MRFIYGVGTVLGHSEIPAIKPVSSLTAAWPMPSGRGGGGFRYWGSVRREREKRSRLSTEDSGWRRRWVYGVYGVYKVYEVYEVWWCGGHCSIGRSDHTYIDDCFLVIVACVVGWYEIF